MSETILMSISEDDLRRIVRESVREELSQDVKVTQKEIAAMFGVTVTTVQAWERRGKIKRITPPGEHPKYLLNQIKQK